MPNLEKLMYLAGVSADYLDYSGRHQTVAFEQRLKILAAMGYAVADPAQVAERVFELDAKPWQNWVRPFTIINTGEALKLYFHPDELAAEFCWTIRLEDNSCLNGQFVPLHYPESGDYSIDSIRYSARAIALPPLSIGYHRIDVVRGDNTATGELVVCPDRCFEASPVGDKQWGITCQLYSLRSARNWGIGDFLDLVELIDCLAPLKAGMIGLNPLHALCSDNPDAVSPYSPSDRRFLNPLYLAPELMPEFNTELMDADDSLLSAVATLRQGTLVDYPAVSALKYRLFEILYERFRQQHLTQHSASCQAFRHFRAEGGEALQTFCEYEAARNPHARRFATEPDFFAYLQWQASCQLEHCQQHAAAQGMAIGLIGDIAVGSVSPGNEVQANRDIYRTGATIGAPPDPFSSTGQDWGLPVTNPVSLRQGHFRQFIQLLRANMTGYGAIRIDHVMSLMRLWWCLPTDEYPYRTGAYVYYPFTELLALLRLESQRCRCQVIGEDLGVVPQDFRHEMFINRILGNSVFYFEQHHNHYFKSPHEHREQAVLMVTNHDVPTLADWWSGGDIQRRFDLGVIQDEAELSQVAGQRQQEKHHLLHLLTEQGLLPPAWRPDHVHQPYDIDLCEAIHRLCARSASRWVLLQLEDLQMMTEPVNIPGTFREYPNWRRKQASNTADVLTDAAVIRLLTSVDKERTRDQV